MSATYEMGGLKLYRRGAHYHIRGTLNGQRVRKTTGTTDLRLARVALDDIYTGSQGWRPGEQSEDSSWADVAKWVCNRHKTRAKEYGVPFDLTPGDIYALMRDAQFRCSISGIALTRRAGPTATPDPWSASIDRIEPRHGYLKDNVRIVCLVANVAMNRWGHDTLLRLAHAVVRNSGSAIPEEILTQTVDTQ